MIEDKEKITIDKEILQTLLSNFYRVCIFCDELDIYEHENFDESMQIMKEWAKDTFGSERKIDKEVYESK